MNRQTKRRNRNRRVPNGVRVSDLDGKELPIVRLDRWLVAPPRVLVKLRYRVDANLTSAAAVTASKSWNANGVYDVDPAVGSTAAAGFTEWGALYGLNRVIKCTVRGHIVCQEAFALVCGYGFVPQVIGAGSFTNAYYGNKNCSEFIMGGTAGMNRHEFVRAIEITDLFGEKATIGDQSHFYGTGASNPITIGQFCLGIHSPSGTPLTGAGGIYYSLQFDFVVEFAQQLALTV